MAHLEITTHIGCKNNCRYCPQENLISSYTKRSNIMQMPFSTFKKCLDKLPKSVRIDFSGMAEPWLNPRCTEMLLYAHECGFKIAVFTTLVGMNLSDIDKIKNIPFECFSVHLPDGDGLMDVKVDNTYLKKITKINNSSIKNMRFKIFGNLHPEIKKSGIEELFSRKALSRAGNIDNENIAQQITLKKGKLTCRYDRFYGNILLPNGDVLLCCMDYAMKHIIGNLVSSNYKSLFDSAEFRKVKKGLTNDSMDLLCRKCSFSKEIS